jgi:soluble lytic murein transglycosylase-like protein
MWKLALCLLGVGAVAGPVTFALAATEDGRATDSPARIDRNTLALETESLAERGEDERRAGAAERREEHQDRRAQKAPRVPAALEAIAACESGGDPAAVGGGGAYRGKYQFGPETWASVGGSGDPADAPEAEQDRRAAMLYEREGARHWPVCGT